MQPCYHGAVSCTALVSCTAVSGRVIQAMACGQPVGLAGLAGRLKGSDGRGRPALCGCCGTVWLLRGCVGSAQEWQGMGDGKGKVPGGVDIEPVWVLVGFGV
jgi:hypothetical protein